MSPTCISTFTCPPGTRRFFDRCLSTCEGDCIEMQYGERVLYICCLSTCMFLWYHKRERERERERELDLDTKRQKGERERFGDRRGRNPKDSYRLRLNRILRIIIAVSNLEYLPGFWQDVTLSKGIHVRLPEVTQRLFAATPFYVIVLLCRTNLLCRYTWWSSATTCVYTFLPGKTGGLHNSNMYHYN